MANTLAVIASGAVGFIDWLDRRVPIALGVFFLPRRLQLFSRGQFFLGCVCHFGSFPLDSVKSFSTSQNRNLIFLQDDVVLDRHEPDVGPFIDQTPAPPGGF